MNILVLNGSPHMDGNTVAMVQAFVEGASEKGHIEKSSFDTQLWKRPCLLRCYL